MAERKITQQRAVYIKVSFLNIEDIDVISGRFKADIFFQARWRELSLDHSKTSADIKWESYWNPNLYIENTVSEVKHYKWNVLEADDKGSSYVIEKHILKGTFSKEMRLEMYPFDIQSLPLLMASKLTTDNVQLLEEDTQLSNVHLETFHKYHEWDLNESVDFVQGITAADDIFSMANSPNIEVTCFARRKSGFFFWNVFLLTALNTLLSFTVFTVNRSLPDFRIRLGFILFLSGVAFKFTISRFIPGIPYLTQLDKYVIGNSFFIALTCVWHAVVTINFDGVTIGEEEDKWALVAFASGYVLLQMVYILNIFISGYRVWSHVRRVSNFYKTKKQNLAVEESKLANRKSMRRKATQKKFVWNNKRKI